MATNIDNPAGKNVKFNNFDEFLDDKTDKAILIDKDIAADQDKPQEEKQNLCEKDMLYSVFWIFTGVSTLFVWNSVLSLSAYWGAKIDPAVNTTYPFVFCLGGLISYFAFPYLNHFLSYKTHVVIWPIILTLIFVGYFILCESNASTSLKYWIFLVGC